MKKFLLYFLLLLPFIIFELIITLIVSVNQIGYTEKVNATVEDFEVRFSEEDNIPMYYPIVSFDYNGNHYTSVSTWGDSDTEYQIGSDIDILINPSDTKQFYDLAESKSMNSLRIGGGIFGLVLIVIVGLSTKNKKIDEFSN